MYKKFFTMEKVSLDNTIFFTLKTLFTDRYLEESEMVLLQHCYENPLLDPLFLSLGFLKEFPN